MGTIVTRKGGFAMLYKKFGKTDESISILGFGCMRLPIIGDDPANIDEKEAIHMIRHAIDQGVNYVDTAYPYHQKMSEPLVGKALGDGYREKVYLATKLPSWLIKSPEDFDFYLNEQLEKLQTDHIDFYLVHTLNQKFWDNLLKNNLFEFLDRIKAEGKVKYIGFSFHDELPLFKEIADAYPWTFCQIQYNLLDRKYQAGEEGLKYAHEKGLGTIIMEPLRGGFFTRSIPSQIQSKWDEAETKRSPAEWGFKFLWNNPMVDLVLSGMSTLEQVEENIKIASETKPNSLTKAETQLIDAVSQIYHDRIAVDCTNCKYCMPCPYSVNIPGCFEFLNQAAMFDDVEHSRSHYNMFIGEKHSASLCVECGKCEKACPQNIPIREKLKDVVNLFEKK